MRHLLVIAFALLTSIALGGETLLLNGDWKFKLDPQEIGEEEGWFHQDFNDAEWDMMPVPADFGQYNGDAWYRKTITLNPAWREGHWVLHFAQVDDEAAVYLDGELVAENHSWNRPFFFPLSPHVDEEPREAVLAVRVTDQGGPGGIMKSVRVIEADNIEALYKSQWSDEKPVSTLKGNGHVVLYSVFVRNFTPEGTFAALEDRLPELEGLGVNALWLLPIHEIGEKERKGSVGSPYAIKDYYSIHPDLGTEEDFRSLVQAAHSRGMRVIIDLVLNHTSPDSVLTEEHPEWFRRNEKGEMTARVEEWWDIVDLDWNQREVWDYSLDMMEYWVREFDIDGYRADVASMMPTEFWYEARQRLEQIKPEGLLMLAESDAEELHVAAFDLTYGWALYDSAKAVIAGRLPVTDLKETATLRQMRYPSGATQILFTENHDKERAINEFGGAPQAKLAAVLTATLPGVPLLYTGTEVGAREKRDIFEHIPVKFDQDVDGMRAHYATLLALREGHPALQVGELIMLDAQPEEHVLAFERRHEGEGAEDRVLILLNLSNEAQTLELQHELMPTETLELGAFKWSIFTAGEPK